MKYLPLARQAAVAAFGLCSIVLSGCATVTPFDDHQLRNLRYQSLAVSSAQTPAFQVMLPGSAILRRGDEKALQLLASHPVSDPAKTISRQLVKHLQDLHSVRVTTDSQSARYGLKVDTLNWGLTYDGIRFEQYRVSLNSRIQIRDLKSNSIVAEANCHYASNDGESTPTLADYLDKDNSTLSLELERAIHYCINYFVAGLFPANGDHSYEVPLPARSEFMAHGPVLYQLPSDISSIRHEALYWLPGKDYSALESANRTEREITQARRELVDAQLLGVGRVAQRDFESSGGSKRNMTACKTSPELFAFCHY